MAACINVAVTSLKGRVSRNDNAEKKYRKRMEKANCVARVPRFWKKCFLGSRGRDE